MSRSRGLLFFLLVGALTLLAFIARPERASVASEDVPLSVPTTTPAEHGLGVAPTATSPPPTAGRQSAAASSSSQAGDPSATPLAFFASELQTPAPGRTPSDNGSPPDGWNPPPLEVPIARHPYDHYWLIRPVGSNYNNFGLPHYPYGSNGPANDLRIHHGVDLANPIGIKIYAAAPGTVLSADKGHFNEYESITSYGNTVVVEHDFGYRGQPVYTLYAHLSAMLVRKGDRVEAGQVIGLIGSTGQVSGPHVHFEVRIGRNSYFAVRNPDLWMAPYVGTGVIAGQLALEDGELAEDAPITVIDLATGQVVYRTTTYAGFGVNPDDYWGENFTIPDVPTGHYLITGRYNATTWSAEVEVLAGVTNWAEMERHDPGATDGAEELPSPNE
jgi:murein DD-endopeptidase MepM/ murein hydrolase activator NlpD